MYSRLVHLFIYLLLLIPFSESTGVLQEPLVQQNEIQPNTDRMIVGVRGRENSVPGRIEIKWPSIGVEWEWNVRMMKATDNLSGQAKSCIANSISVTEVKWAANGTKIVAVVGNAAVVLNYAPENPELDKSIDFAVCVDDTHTLELLPDDFLAVATSGNSQSDGIKIYDIRICERIHGELDPQPVQVIRGFPAVHGLLWDGTSRRLWAIGNDKSPFGWKPSQGLLRGYPFNPNYCRNLCHRRVLDGEVVEYPVSEPRRLNEEWGPNWWEGPHDLAGIPNTRKILITTDLDVFGFDVESGSFLNETQVIGYLAGFEPVGDRHGLPRSDIKSISVNSGIRIIYVQSEWGESFGKDVRIISRNGTLLQIISIETSVYKARWFTGIPGWPAAL